MTVAKGAYEICFGEIANTKDLKMERITIQ
jgi:hypothetical protein